MDDQKPETGTDLIGLGRAAVQLIQTGEKFVEMLFGPYLRERGELMADPVRQRRQNLAMVAGMAKEQIGDAEMRTIPGRILFPLASAAMNEDSTDMQRRWAALLASAITSPDNVSPAFPRILSDLSPREVQLLDWVFDESAYRDDPDHLPPRTIRVPTTTLQTAMEHLGATELDTYLAVSNLDRLGLVITTERTGNPIGTTEGRFMHIRPTPFGAAFVRTCRPPSSATL